ncbi:hypothetical protein PV08_02793 [Exophiala spinifera]|uniref:Uncharacterized protein n=1 Tax=Exophiala spinifera TaxID=91928 RepID=A0A0D2BIX9_9EURO|nr:uncharacterized protein PV08_02793 [Exophiala spinifera]KIW18505.1 hypothetical protein PV08_02793 [Exophiala spinifera]
MDSIAPIELHLEPDTELADADTIPFDAEEIRNCKIVTSVSRARYGKFRQSDACFLVVKVEFLPFYNIRFKYAEIELRLVKPSGLAQGPALPQQPAVAAYAPKRWQGVQAAKNIQKSIHTGVNTGIATQAVTGVSAGAEAGVDHTVQYAEMRRAWVESELEQTMVTWRLCENDVTHEGIPKPFLGAVIVSATDSVAIRMRYYVKLSKSVNPLSWTAGHARMSKPLTLDRATIGQGLGPDVEGIGAMEQDTFKLEDFAPTNWTL